MRYVTSTLILISLCFAIVACSNSPTLSKEEVSNLIKDFATKDIINHGSVSYCESLLGKIKTSEPILILYDHNTETWSVNMPSHFEYDYMKNSRGDHYKVQKEFSYSWTVNDKTQAIKPTGSVTIRFYDIQDSKVGLRHENRRSDGGVEVLNDAIPNELLREYADLELGEKPFC